MMSGQNSNHVMYMLVQRLCESFIPSQHDNFNKICQYSFDLITTKKMKIEASEEQYILSKIRDNFFRDGRFQESTMFDDMYHRLKLSSYRNVNLGELLYCFLLLSNNGEEGGAANSIIAVTNNLQRIQLPVENDYESIDLNAHYMAAAPTNRFAHDVAMRRNHYGSMASIVSGSRPHTIHGEPGLAYEVVNRQNILAMDLVNIFQGIPGKYITFIQGEKFLFHFERMAEFASNDVFLAKRLSVMGQHFKMIRNCATIASGNTSKGLVFQSFGSALEDQVREFYKLMTSIQANFHNSSGVVTMHKLTVWIYETATKFEALSNMIGKCKTKRGGALVAVIYDYMNHGDPIVRDIVRAILSKVVKPIRQMMNHWIFYGELKDDFREFFISINSDTSAPAANDFWRDKYVINKAMLPGFISRDQAFKILNTGKAISMLREVENKVNLFLPVYDQLKMSFENSKLETLFVKRGAVTQSSDFSHLLDYLYKEICQVALNLLNEKYTLHGHFCAHKRYLLFGQGDFISYLCENVSPKMTGVVQSNIIYALNQSLETTILKTSANCENPEILSKLDISIGNSRNQFCLKYKADGALATIFTEQTQIVYAKTFDLLWTIKRFNFKTKEYFIQLRMMFKPLKHLPPTFRSINNNFSTILHQISHFLYTIESYFSSTIENRWQTVKHELDNPLSLDRLIKAHRKFLQAIERQLFFTRAPELGTEFNKICDQIWEFYHKLDEYITPIYKMMKEDRMAHAWQDELTECHKEYDCEYPIWLVNFSKTFNITVVNFLENLVETEEDSLQELCLCIDFNHFYKRTILAN